jgi:hypothetical protein
VTALETTWGGSHLELDSQYGQWDSFSTTGGLEQATWDCGRGTTPQITWKFNFKTSGSVSANDIAAGLYDTQLTDQANALNALGCVVLLRIWPGMDQSIHGGPYTVDPAVDPITAGGEFVAMWQHLYGIVHPICSACRFVWSPNIHAFDGTLDANGHAVWTDFYPGDAYVDRLATSHYNNTTTALDFRTTLFGQWYTALSGKGKPMMFSETGAESQDPQMDASGYGCPNAGIGHPSPGFQWLKTIGLYLYNYPLIDAFVWFDASVRAGLPTCNNYTLHDDSAAEMEHLRNDLARFQGGQLP